MIRYNDRMMFLASFFIFLLPLAVEAQEQRAVASARLTRPEMEEFLLTASIVTERELVPGAKYSLRITLDDGKRKHDAAVKTEDGTTPDHRNYIFNVAAYEMDKALELHLVPPSVLRKVSGRPASVTWWVDDVAMDERYRRSKKIEPPDPDSWNKQMQAVRLFDELVANPYRNIRSEHKLSTSQDNGPKPDYSWIELLITRD